MGVIAYFKSIIHYLKYFIHELVRYSMTKVNDTDLMKIIRG